MTGALAGWDVRPRLGELRMPTLVLRGAHDMSTPAISKTLTEGIPRAREVVFTESWGQQARNRRMRYEEMEATSYYAVYFSR